MPSRRTAACAGTPGIVPVKVSAPACAAAMPNAVGSGMSAASKRVVALERGERAQAAVLLGRHAPARRRRPAPRAGASARPRRRRAARRRGRPSCRPTRARRRARPRSSPPNGGARPRLLARADDVEVAVRGTAAARPATGGERGDSAPTSSVARRLLAGVAGVRAQRGEVVLDDLGVEALRGGERGEQLDGVALVAGQARHLHERAEVARRARRRRWRRGRRPAWRANRTGRERAMSSTTTTTGSASRPRAATAATGRTPASGREPPAGLHARASSGCSCWRGRRRPARALTAAPPWPARSSASRVNGAPSARQSVPSPSGARHRGAARDELEELVLGRGVVGAEEAVGHDRRDLARRQRVRERLDAARAGSVGRRAARERRVEVGDRDVVGLERLEAADLEAAPVARLEEQRRRGVAHLAVGVRGLALELGRAALGGAGLGAVGLVGLGDLVESSMPMSASASSRGTRASASRSASSVSSGSGVVNCVNCSARNIGHSSSGRVRRVATTSAAGAGGRGHARLGLAARTACRSGGSGAGRGP